MDSALTTPHVVMYCMLFATIMAATADQPAAVPAVFQRMWRRYHAFQAARRIREAVKSKETFWEIDMTKFEP